MIHSVQTTPTEKSLACAAMLRVSDGMEEGAWLLHSLHTNLPTSLKAKTQIVRGLSLAISNLFEVLLRSHHHS